MESTAPNMKSREFWTKADSVPAWIVLVTIGAALVFGWGMIVPFLASMMVSTFKLVAFGLGTAALLFLATSTRVRMMVRVFSRVVMNAIIPIFPIEILKDKIARMRERREEMGEQVKNLRGQIGLLERTISENARGIETSLSEASYAKNKATSAGDEEEQLRMAAKAKLRANRAGRLERANLSYQDLLQRLRTMYNRLTKLSIHIDTFIEDTEDEVRHEEIKYKTINAAHKALSAAINVLTGSAHEDDMYNSTMEFLADEAGRKLGEMEELYRVAQGFMDDMDIRNGSVSDVALKQLDAYDSRLLTAGTKETELLRVGSAPQVLTVVGSRPGANNLDDLFNR